MPVTARQQVFAKCRQYKKAMKGVRSLLLTRTSPAPDGLVYIAEKRHRKGALEPKMDHLVCFLPGEYIPAWPDNMDVISQGT